jgi:hypothetical protein
MRKPVKVMIGNILEGSKVGVWKYDNQNIGERLYLKKVHNKQFESVKCSDFCIVEFNYKFIGEQPILIRVRKLGYKPIEIEDIISKGGVNLVINQEIDHSYEAVLNGVGC